MKKKIQRKSDHVFPAYGAAGACLKETTPSAPSVSQLSPPSLGNTHLLPEGGDGFKWRYFF